VLAFAICNSVTSGFRLMIRWSAFSLMRCGPQDGSTPFRTRLPTRPRIRRRSRRRGDTLGVWRLDRLGRSLPHLVKVVQKLEADGVCLRSLTEGIDTTTSNSRLVYAQFERDLSRERTLAAIASAVTCLESTVSVVARIDQLCTKPSKGLR
jgi:Resolvase, N terminal domain